MILGCHVSMSGDKMLLGAAQQAVSYGANTMMIFTGAPQNSRRKPTSQMNITQGWHYLKQHQIQRIMGHAPYIINLGNTKDLSKYEFAIDFLQAEIQRCAALQIEALSFHPGAHVGLGAPVAIKSIAQGLQEVLKSQPQVKIALETMSGKGTEIGATFEQLAQIIDLTPNNEQLAITFDTCHVHDAGYDIVNDFDGVLLEFDKIIGLDRLAMIHLNDSKNGRGSHKDRHTNIGFGQIGFKALNYICHHPQLAAIPKIMETPYVPLAQNPKKAVAPYASEIKMLQEQQFDPQMQQRLSSS